MDNNLEQAYKDADEFLSYLRNKTVWSFVLKAEIQYKLFHFNESKALLEEAITQSPKLDLNLVAALFQVEKKRRQWANDITEDKKLALFASVLSAEEKDRLKEIEQTTNWDEGFLKSSPIHGESTADSLWIDLESLAIRVYN